MPALVVRTGDGRERSFALSRRITSIGRSGENDLALPDPALPETALHIHSDGRDYNAVCHAGTEMEVNGRRKVTARLADGDRIRLGASELVFTLRDVAARAPAGAPAPRVEAMERLVRF